MTPHCFETKEKKKKRILFSLISEYPEYAKELLAKQTGTNTLVSGSAERCPECKCENGEHKHGCSEYYNGR